MNDLLKFFVDTLKSFGNVFRLAEYLPDILRESGSMFGVFALVAILMALMVVFFFRNSETKQKERVFLYTSLFLLTLVFSALIAGVSTGFETGREIAITDPAIVELSPSTVKALENYLTAEGENITDKNKSRVLSEALSSYFADSNDSSLAATPSAAESIAETEEEGLTVTVGASSSSAPDGFRVESRGCSQRDSTIRCDTLVTNTREDISIFLFADGYRSASRLVDGDGNQYTASVVVIGNEESSSYQLVPFATNVPVKVTLVVTNAGSKASQISLIDLLGSTKDRLNAADMSVQVRDVRVRN